MKRIVLLGIMVLSLLLVNPVDAKAKEVEDWMLTPSQIVMKEFRNAIEKAVNKDTAKEDTASVKSEDKPDQKILYPAYSEEDLYILAHVICGEAQGYPDDEQLYVGSVVLNRVSHPSFPNTIAGVVFQKGQYACTKDGNYYREPTPQNWANARLLLENGSVLPGNVVWQSGGRQGRGEYLRTRYHSYCY